MKQIYNFRKWTLILFIPFFALSSCGKFLNIDDYFSDELELDSVFASKRYIDAYVRAAAAAFPDEGKLQNNNYTPGPYATDEGFTSFLTSSAYNGMRYVLGEIRADAMYEFQNWEIGYGIIRKVNTIFKRIDEVKDMTNKEKFETLGYSRFLRAYAYYNILVDYGPPIIVGDDVVPSNAELSVYDRGRSTYEEAVEYICNEFEEAAKLLPETTPIIDFGAPTKAAAYGLIARIRLTAASPLYNGGTAARSTFGSWRRSTDGEYYVPQQYDEEKWAVAAAAAKRVMDLQKSGGQAFKLHVVEADSETPELPEGVTSDPDYYEDWPVGANGIDHYRSYKEMFNGESVIPINPEYVWARYSSGLTEGIRKSFPQQLEGWNGASLPQKIIDNYEMVDGRSINNSSAAYPYTEQGFTNQTTYFSGYRLESDVSNMYVNREARFYASVGFSGTFWPMTSSTTAGFHDQRIDYYYDSPNGKGGVGGIQDHPETGYVIKKYIHPNDAWGGTNARVIDKAFPIIRYAEILLSYAEALNNLTGSYTVEVGEQKFTVARDINEIKNAFNQVRHRAGLPGMNGTEDVETVQKKIEKERMIEFLWENRRYYDVRRWGIYEQTENETIQGMNIEANKDNFYVRVIPNHSYIGERVVNKKLILLPIPLREVRLLPSLDQNPGWLE